MRVTPFLLPSPFLSSSYKSPLMNLDSLKAHIKTLDPTAPTTISDAERDYFRHYQINFEERLDRVAHHFGHLDCGRADLVVHYFALENAVSTCFIVHGYYDHAGLYGHLIEFCLQKNCSVVIFDLPGHGLSTGERASIASFEDYQYALRSVLTFFEMIAPKPWRSIGQSTGAAILMDFMLSGGEEAFERSVLLAPLYQPVGWRTGKFFHALAYPWIKKTSRHFLPNSHDQQFLDFIKQRDPLQYRYLSLTWVAALKQWIKHFDLLQPVGYAPLIIQGKQDGTVDWRRNLPVIQQKFPNATVFFLAEGFHHLANEREDIRSKMLAAITLYFEQQSS